MKILFLGDIVGSGGRRVIRKLLPSLKKQHQIDLVIANGENAAHGKGMTRKIYNQLCSYGIDYFTMGNHTFAKKDIENFINSVDNMVRPANMHPLYFGKHTIKIVWGNKKIALINLMGEVFMHNTSESPFSCMQTIVEETKDCDIRIVDLHAETTSEKIAFCYAFKDITSLIVGTHTHVQTADERILDGCGCISDLGMCGVFHSVLGRDVDEIVSRFMYSEKKAYTIASGRSILQGIVAEIDENTNCCISIERIQELEENEQD